MKTEKEDTQTLSPRALEYLELRKIRRNQKEKKKNGLRRSSQKGRKRNNQDSEVY